MFLKVYAALKLRVVGLRTSCKKKSLQVVRPFLHDYGAKINFSRRSLETNPVPFLIVEVVASLNSFRFMLGYLLSAFNTFND